MKFGRDVQVNTRRLMYWDFWHHAIISSHFTHKSAASWWVHTQHTVRLPTAYAAAPASGSSWSLVHSFGHNARYTYRKTSNKRPLRLLEHRPRTPADPAFIKDRASIRTLASSSLGALLLFVPMFRVYHVNFTPSAYCQCLYPLA